MKVSELVKAIYDDNYSHLELVDNMGRDCDCQIHKVLQTILEYWKVSA